MSKTSKKSEHQTVQTKKNNNDEEVFEKIKWFLSNPEISVILAEIIVQKEIEANGLIKLKTIDVKKSALYEHLKSLEENGFIISNIKKVLKGRNRKYEIKTYQLNKNYVENLSRKVVESARTRPRDARLFALYLITAFIQREIRILLRSTNKNIKIRQEEDLIYAGMSFLDIETVEAIKPRFNKIVEDIQKINEEKEKERGDEIVIDPFMFYFGIIEFTEILERMNKK